MTPQRTSMKTPLGLITLVLLLGAALAGCLGQDAEAASGELYVKDQLTDEASAVYITFNQAEVLPADSRAWETVFEGEQTIEMLSLAGPDAKAKLSDFELEPGEYLRMRITITNVTVVDHDGNRTEYPALGNVVTIGHDIRADAGGSFEVLVDFDLENGVDLENGTYVPVVGFAQTTHKDQQGRATESNRTDRPEQSNAMDHRGIFGVCTAWENSEQGRSEGNATNSTAFTWLQEQAANESQSVEAFCEEHGRPGAPSSLYEVLPEQMPEQARAAVEDRPLGPPSDAGADERGSQGSQGSDRGRSSGQGNQTSGPSGQGNQTGGGPGGQGPPE